MSQEPDSFSDFVLSEILEAKAEWLGLVCASLIPNRIANLEIKGNYKLCEAFLKARSAVVKDYPNRSEVWANNVKIAEFAPKLVDGKMVLDAYIAGVRVAVGSPVLPPSENN